MYIYLENIRGLYITIINNKSESDSIGVNNLAQTLYDFHLFQLGHAVKLLWWLL